MWVSPSRRADLHWTAHILRAQDLDSKSLDAALSALPMLADRRILIIKDASALKKDARKVLDRYLEKPSPDVLVMLLESSGGKTDKDLVKNTTRASLTGGR